MPNKIIVKFPGQYVTIALDNQETRRRIDRTLKEKYRGQIALSTYCKLAIIKQLEEDEIEEDKNEGRGASPTRASANDTDTIVVVHANTPTKEPDVNYG